MGEQKNQAQPDGIMPNGLLPAESANVTRLLDPERWAVAEQRTAQLIERIQPSKISDLRRNAVFNYVQRIVTNCFPCKVCQFGSVPLKTYLPDGDIDMTALSFDNDLKDIWANKVRHALESEEKNENAEFRVKEVQYIQAEVKIIKCLVENIVVDLSFNQVGGLSTLMFLLEADTFISQRFLFKRSIILIKAWCYYESRILGAHHGLISTYALEILVLYIFHVFNNKFAGPLEVLYRFLEFFSNYDWENYCISIYGPVPISSLPNMIVEPPRSDGGGDLLPFKSFLDGCVIRYSVKPGGPESGAQPFASKHFNVIDPLRTNNNLGRSVSKGNFFRIRSAFAFGAKRLARLLECPKDDLISELNQFFMNTWERHGRGNRPDAPSSILHHPKNISFEDPRNYRTAPTAKKKSYSENTDEAHGITESRAGPQSNLYRKSNSPKVSSTQNQFEASSSNNNSSRITRPRDQKTLKSHYSLNTNNSTGLARFQFARTRSSPDLTDSSTELFARGRHEKPAWPENGGSRIVNNQSSTSSSLDDYENGYPSVSEELASVPETVELRQEMTQEEQDPVNITGMQGFNGQVQLPMHVTSPNLPLAFSPLLAHANQVQENWTRILPPNLANLSLVGPPWGGPNNVQIPPGFVSPSVSPFCQSPAFDERSESARESSPATVEQCEEEDSSNTWQGQDGKKRDPLGGSGFVSLPRGSSGFVQPAHTHENQAGIRSSNPGPSAAPVLQESPSRGKTSYEGPRDRVRDNKWGRKPSGAAIPSAGPTSPYGKLKPPPPGWYRESTQEEALSETDNESRDWGTTSAGEDASSSDKIHQVPFGYEPTQTNSLDPMIPFRPVVLGSSGTTFIPTGPPIFYMFPVGNVPRDTANPNPSHVEREDGTNPSLTNWNSDPVDNVDMGQAQLSPAPLPTASSSESDEYRPDVLNSDFDIHFQNLLYGQFCQNTPYPPAPLMGPPPVVVPQMQLFQGQFPADGQSRPVSGNMNLTQFMSYGPRLIPLVPLQSGSDRVFVVPQPFGEESPRSRGGTGTYLPNPKVPYRERQSNTRSHRWNHTGGDRNDHVDRDGSWISAKQRAAAGRGHGHGRNQSDRPSPRSDRRHHHSMADNNQPETQWQTYRSESFPAIENPPHGTTTTNRKYGMYLSPGPNSNGMGSSVLMVYPYEQGSSLASEPVEFGLVQPRPDGEVLSEVRPGVYSPDKPSSPHIRR